MKINKFMDTLNRIENVLLVFLFAIMVVTIFTNNHEVSL